MTSFFNFLRTSLGLGKKQPAVTLEAFKERAVAEEQAAMEAKVSSPAQVDKAVRRHQRKTQPKAKAEPKPEPKPEPEIQAEPEKPIQARGQPARKEDLRFDHIQPLYLEALTLIERLHRRLLDVIKDEFDRRGRSDINSVQALLLYNIGDKELTAGELRTRGYYLGPNVSANLTKLTAGEFLDHQRSRVDHRSVRIKLTAKGQEVRDIVDTLYQKHVRTVEQVGGINADEFATLNKSLHRLERFWTDQILYRL